MERAATGELIAWKNRKNRKPLLVRGVRQSGKTYLLQEFGRTHFRDVAYFNFESFPSLTELFERDLNPRRILMELGVLSGKKIEPETTLVIWDEVQFCPKALTALKYFAEQTPEYAVACAGSLLGLSLARPSSFPVGKVDVILLRPMSFHEFLSARDGTHALLDYLSESRAEELLPQVFVDKLITFFKEFQLTGGMPEAVKTWMESEDLSETERIQDSILRTYELDFAKHAPATDFPKLSSIWKSIPAQLARANARFVYSQARAGARAKDLEDALQWLVDAGMVYKVHRVETAALPLSAYVDQKAFKLFAADIGLLRRLAGVPGAVVVDESPLYREFKGAMTENYVLHELVCALGEIPYYWTSGNTAEVDFVIQAGNRIIPLEVKSSRNVRSRSLRVYREKYRPAAAIRTSMLNVRKEGELWNIPLYLLWNIGAYLSF
ncbi:MAG: ATP-binding protein [Spirochaetales bacterium]|nr:ATP-binding protein [Spirochaetales bacterium]